MASEVKREFRGGDKRPQLTRGPRGIPIAASDAQRHFYKIQSEYPKYFAINCFSAKKLMPNIDIPIFKKSLHELVKKHEIYRTQLTQKDNDIVQIIVPEEKVQFEVGETDLSSLDPNIKIKELEKVCNAFNSVVYDLSKHLLFKFHLFKLDPYQYVFFHGNSHAITDRFTGLEFEKEVAIIYHKLKNGGTLETSGNKFEFLDYCLWENENATTEKCGKQVEYWRKQLEGAPGPINISIDYPRPKGVSGYYKFERIRISDETWRRVKEVAAAEHISITTLGMSFIHLYMHLITGQDDIMSCKIIDMRFAVEGAEKIWGPVFNAVFIRSKLLPKLSYKEYIKLMTQTIHDAYANALFGSYRIRRVMNSEFKVQFYTDVFTRASYDRLSNNKPVVLEPMIDGAGGISMVDLWLVIEYDDEGAVLEFQYNVELFKNETIKNMLTDCLNVIDYGSKNLDQQIAKYSLSSPTLQTRRD